jgi:hypothetical protein
MTRPVLALLALAVLTASTTAVAAHDRTPTGVAGVAVKKQKVILGFHANRTIRYFDFGEIKLKAGNKIGKMWVFANGADGQLTVVDSVPASKRYTPLRRVYRVTWKDGASAHLLRSAAAVARAEQDGDVAIRATRTVVNATVLGFGQVRHAGFARDKVIHYYELGVVKLRPGNEVLPIWTFTNGVDGQRNIADVVPGTTAYPPLWGVVEATWEAGATPRLLRSHAAMMQAVQARELTLEKTSIVVNCPFV